MPFHPTTCERCGINFVARFGPKHAGKYCGQTCYHAAVKRSPEDRFWSKVLKTETCWLWQGHITRFGYGRFSKLAGEPVFAHRFSYELRHGPIPNGLFVCHNCPGGDNPLCVNPDHLFLGTTTDNIRDCIAKGRIAKGERHGSRTHPERWLWANNGRVPSEKPRRKYRTLRAKLKEADIPIIRRRYAAGETLAEIGRSFGATPSHISGIVRGKSWKHVP